MFVGCGLRHLAIRVSNALEFLVGPQRDLQSSYVQRGVLGGIERATCHDGDERACDCELCPIHSCIVSASGKMPAAESSSRVASMGKPTMLVREPAMLVTNGS